MGISTVGVSTSSGAAITPFDAPFNYNFTAEAEGTFIDLDLGISFPAATYLMTGKARGYAAPARIQAIDSTGTVVGTGTCTGSTGSWDATNEATYTASITATGPFSKVRFTGDSNGSRVRFNSSAPTLPDYHLTISAGSRTITETHFPVKLFTDSAKITKNNAPGAIPAGQFKFGAGWYYNNKWYTFTQSIEGNPTGSTNTIRVISWDYATSTWTTMASANPSAIGMQAFATFYNDNGLYNPVWNFKSGAAVMYNDYMFNTSGSGTPTYAAKAWYYNGTSTLTGSSTIPTTYLLANGGSCYNPTNDEWYHIGGNSATVGTSSGIISRISNNGTIESMNLSPASGNQGSNVIFAQDSATPKINVAYQRTSNGYFNSAYWASWSNGGSQTGSEYTTNSPNPQNYSPVTTFGPKRGVITTFNGISNYFLAVQHADSNQQWLGGAYTFSTSAAGQAQSAPHSTMKHLGDSDSGLGYNYSIGPVSSTETGVVRWRNTYGSGATIGAQIVVLPTTITYP